MISRCPHDKENPFVMINKASMQDNDLSWAARGLLGYLLSLPNDWNISVSHLAKQYKKKGGGKTAIYQLLEELITQGYCVRSTKKNEKGQFNEIDYVISEFKKKVPHSGNPNTVEPNTGQRSHTNIESILNNDIEREVPSLPNEPTDEIDFKAEREFDEEFDRFDPDKNYIGPHGYLKITLKEYRNLCEKHGKKTVDRVAEDLDLWLGRGKGKKETNHYLTLIAFLKKDKAYQQEKKTYGTNNKRLSNKGSIIQTGGEIVDGVHVSTPNSRRKDNE